MANQTSHLQLGESQEGDWGVPSVQTPACSSKPTANISKHFLSLPTGHPRWLLLPHAFPNLFLAPLHPPALPLHGSFCPVSFEGKDSSSVMKGRGSSGNHTFTQSNIAVAGQQHVLLTEADPQSWGQELVILGFLKKNNYKCKMRWGP